MPQKGNDGESSMLSSYLAKYAALCEKEKPSNVQTQLEGGKGRRVGGKRHRKASNGRSSRIRRSENHQRERFGQNQNQFRGTTGEKIQNAGRRGTLKEKIFINREDGSTPPPRA